MKNPPILISVLGFFAALAGFGQGADVAEFSEQTRADLRASALATFRRSPGAAADPLLTPIRDSINDLAPEEQSAWRALWTSD